MAGANAGGRLGQHPAMFRPILIRTMGNTRWSGTPGPYVTFSTSFVVASTLQTFTALRRTECRALLAVAREGRSGAEAALVSRGTNVPLSPAENTFPHRLGAGNVHNFLLQTQTGAYIQKYPPPPVSRNPAMFDRGTRG